MLRDQRDEPASKKLGSEEDGEEDLTFNVEVSVRGGTDVVGPMSIPCMTEVFIYILGI